MKKLLVLLMAIIMVFGLAACGGGEEPAGPDATEPELTAGFILIGSINDGGYTQAHYEAIKATEEYFGGKVAVKYLESVNDSDKQASLDAATNLLDQGCDVIVGCSFGYMDALEELANSGNYDDKQFIHFSGYKMNDTNFGNFFGSIEEPRYLSGMIAASMSKDGTLGYVAAHPFTEVQIGINAFTLGAQAVNPDVQVKVVYINTWGDPEKELAAAEQLLAAGCDVITQHSDSTGPQLAAQDVGAYAIGYNFNNPAAPKAYLTAPIWHHEKFLIPTLEDIMAGSWTPESYYGTMAEGYVDLAPMTDLVPADVQEKVNAVKEQMAAGEFAPFSGKIEFVDGTLLCEEGQTLTREEIWETKQLIKGTVAVQ